MKYEQPNVTLLGSATSAVQETQTGKPDGFYNDLIPGAGLVTNAAYQADE